MEPDTSFWQSMTELIITQTVIIDRPKGASHPRCSETIYPLDYGYFENATSSDGGGINVWLGSLNSVINEPRAKTLTGILCTFDTLKHDAEIKFLIGCNEEDIKISRDFLKGMNTLSIPNPTADNDLSN